MTVRVFDEKSFFEFDQAVRNRDDARRDERILALKETVSGSVRIACDEPDLPVDKVISALIWRRGTRVAWCEVFEKLDARTFV